MARRELQPEPRGDGVAIPGKDLDGLARAEIGTGGVRGGVRWKDPAGADGGGHGHGVTMR